MTLSILLSIAILLPSIHHAHWYPLASKKIRKDPYSHNQMPSAFWSEQGSIKQHTWRTIRAHLRRNDSQNLIYTNSSYRTVWVLDQNAINMFNQIVWNGPTKRVPHYPQNSRIHQSNDLVYQNKIRACCSTSFQENVGAQKCWMPWKVLMLDKKYSSSRSFIIRKVM